MQNDYQCPFCFNAYVYAKMPKTEEDYFDNELDDSNDFSSSGIGHSVDGYSIMFNSGAGRACNVEFRKWHEGYGWAPVGYYYPKYCPECGRKLDEYEIDERGTSYDSKRA